MTTTRQPAQPLKYVLQVGGGRLEYEGAHAKGLVTLFTALPDSLARRKMLHDLERAHSGLLKDEARKQSIPDPADADECPRDFMGFIAWITPLLHQGRISPQEQADVLRAHGQQSIEYLAMPSHAEAIPSVWRALSQIAEARPA
jgi:hypothetical protein